LVPFDPIFDGQIEWPATARCLSALWIPVLLFHRLEVWAKQEGVEWSPPRQVPAKINCVIWSLFRILRAGMLLGSANGWKMPVWLLQAYSWNILYFDF
jgi:hypothetical protein